MGNRTQHARNCAANWRGWPLTLTDFVPEDAPCTCGAEARLVARSNVERRVVDRQAA
jgi:hypothetical protein